MKISPHTLNQNHQLSISKQWLRMSDLATSAERKARSYITKDGKIRHIKARPARAGLLPLGESTIWEKVRQGKFPAPHRLSERVTAWKLDDIQEWIDSIN